MFRSAVVLLVALFAVSTYGIQNRPTQLKFTSTWQQRLDRYTALKTCNEHVIRTDSGFSDYVSLNGEGSFRFFTIAETQIDFQLSLVPVRQQKDLYAGEYLRFVVKNIEVSVTNTKGQTFDVAPTPVQSVLLHSEPNEVIVLLDKNQTVTIIVNGVRFEAEVGPQEDIKGFRYVSFALSSDLDVQEFFYDCTVEPNLPVVHSEGKIVVK